MLTLLILLVALIVLGVASVMGWTADSRDPDYGMGAIHSYARRLSSR